MLLNLLNWMIVVCASLTTGRAVLDLFYKAAGRVSIRKNAVSMFAAGTLFLTVYAEIFSIFHAVDLTAFVSVCILTAFLAFYYGRKDRNNGRKLLFSPQHNILPLVGCSVILVFFLILSALQPSSYDDYLYHAQALEWIEKYGVVPGLANLHGRFGFNSAFLCLEALFSWSFSGRSFHALNALYAGLMTVWCVFPDASRLRENGLKFPSFRTSDLLKLCTLIYIAGNTAFLSGSDTDPLAVLTMLYCFIRFAEINEEESMKPEERTEGLSAIAVFSFFACSLKLSAAPAVLLTLSPLLEALKHRRRGLIAASAIGADLTLGPFLVRNVILTGWLVYPFEGLDLFSFDFKIPASLVRGESQSVVLWGRSIMDLIYSGYEWEDLVNMPVTKWAPIWFNSLSSTSRVFALADLVIVPLFFIIAGILFIRKSHERPAVWELVLTLVTVLSLLYWFMTAPSERFGGIYLLLPSACIFAWIGKERSGLLKYFPGIAAAMFSLLLVLRIVSMPAIGMIRSQIDGIGIVPQDYETKEMDANEVLTSDGKTVIIYTPEGNETDQSDYTHFPAAPSTANLQVIELRGNSLKDGFRRIESD